jgi:hypothetical protein
MSFEKSLFDPLSIFEIAAQRDLMRRALKPSLLLLWRLNAVYSCSPFESFARSFQDCTRRFSGFRLVNGAS